jgi:hypothetical protein
LEGNREGITPPWIPSNSLSTKLALRDIALLLSSPATDRGPGAADADEAGPSRRPEVPVLEQTVFFSGDDASSGAIRIRMDPLEWGGPSLLLLD